MGRISKELLSILSFNSTTRRFTFLTIFIFLYFIPVSTLENGPKLSVCAQILKEHCYSVGITRGSAALLHGNIEQSLSYNFLAIPVLTLMLLIIIYDTTKNLKKKKEEKRMNKRNLLFGIAIGLILGTIIGLVTGAILIGATLGAITGGVLGAGFSSKRKIES